MAKNGSFLFLLIFKTAPKGININCSLRAQRLELPHNIIVAVIGRVHYCVNINMPKVSHYNIFYFLRYAQKACANVCLQTFLNNRRC